MGASARRGRQGARLGFEPSAGLSNASSPLMEPVPYVTRNNSASSVRLNTYLIHIMGTAAGVIKAVCHKP